MQFLNTRDSKFSKKFKALLSRKASAPLEVEQKVRTILSDVEKKGDAALFRYTQKFDQLSIQPQSIRAASAEIKEAYRKISAPDLAALKLAAKRIREFHQLIGLKSWQVEKQGVSLGQRVTPLERVGVYVPGGKASYPSSVLMNVIPARVAGVDEICMTTPFPRGEVNPAVLVAADLAGVDHIFKVGGAQAIAALAYGTDSIPQVDKIVGPGNIYVATAKRLVFGKVDIDMIAGPSEIAVVTDGKCDPDWIAADLLSQAEHDEEASSLLFSWNEKFIDRVANALGRLLGSLPRAAIARASLQANGALVLTQSAEEAIELVNSLAPEHLELAVKNPQKLLRKVRNAGAIFLGHWTTESFGDYLAGPNHVLPTNGTARFSSPLSTLDFLKFSSVIECQPRGLKRLGPAVAHLARMEGLEAHALAMKLRMDDWKRSGSSLKNKNQGRKNP